MEILGKDYTLITLDYETYYGTGCSLSLQSMNTFTYLEHPEFTIHGVGIKIDEEPTYWVAPDVLGEHLQALFAEAEKPVALLCHNTPFDAYILHHFWDIHPDLYLDTLAMSRGMFPNRKHSLKDLAERLWPSDPTMRKGEELIAFRNVTTDELYADEEKLTAMVGYCEQDVNLTYAAFMRMIPFYPEDELEIIHLTTQMMCEPLLVLDKELLTGAREQWIADRQATIDAAGVAESTLASNPKFKALLEQNDVAIISKADLRTGAMKPALGKADLGFQQMKAANPNLHHLFDGREATKSVGEIKRAGRFLAMAEVAGGYMPMPLSYYGAATGRYSGSESANVQNLNRGSALRRALCAPQGFMVAVADSSNIEARMLAWLAGQQELLDVFGAGDDVYSFFASILYGFEVNKVDHPHERFVGKVSVLGLGYGQGWRRFKDGMAAGMLGGDPVLFTDAEAQNVVSTYRATNYMITQYWKEAEQAIIDMMMGNDRDWGVLKITRNAIIMPNGMALQYPGLRQDDEGGFEYHNGRFWTRLYGPKLCLAAGTQVLTQRGWEAIESILPGTKVWDGIEWVACDGAVSNGQKNTIALAGVEMTPDHEVLTNEGWKMASQSSGLDRAEAGLPNGAGIRWEQWAEVPVVGESGRENNRRACSSVGDSGVDNTISARSWLALRQTAAPTKNVQQVFDLINSGPRQRFVVRDGDENPMIVHNCENITQALSRIVLFDQMLEINRYVVQDGGRVVLNVHDEVIAVVPEETAEKDFEQMLHIMRQPPAWCHDLPLDAEGGYSRQYDK